MSSNTHASGHLRRLDRMTLRAPLYFITTCTKDRKRILAEESIVRSLRKEWEGALDRYGWAVGSYVVMPDHVHFFCRPAVDAETLSTFVGRWKEWTAKSVNRRKGSHGALWQKEFFDHVLRSDESYSEKWDYVKNNPVREGLVEDADDWEYWGHVHFL